MEPQIERAHFSSFVATTAAVPQDWLEELPVTGSEGAAHRQRLQAVLDDVLKNVPDDLIDR